MIERTTIRGREASVMYCDDAMVPTSRDAATLVKALFDDGEVLFLRAGALEKGDKKYALSRARVRRKRSTKQ